MKQKIFVVTVCGRKIRKEIYDRREERRNSQNKVVVFDKGNFKPGDYVNVRVADCTSATLFGEPI